MTKDKIQNKIQLEIINVNKIIANKRRETESKEEIKWRIGMNFFMTSMHFEEKKREKKERKEKKFQVKSRRNTIHMPSREEEDTKINQMM